MERLNTRGNLGCFNARADRGNDKLIRAMKENRR